MRNNTLILGLIFCLIGTAPALAQLTLTPSTNIVYEDFDGVMSIPSGGSPDLIVTPNSMELTGDITLTNNDDWLWRMRGIVTAVVGPLPVLVDVDFTTDLKSVLAANQLNVVDMTTTSTFSFHQFGSLQPMCCGIYTIQDVDHVTPGIEFLNDQDDIGPVLLGPGVYDFQIVLISQLDIAGPLVSPVISTIEFGKISNFDGIKATFSSQTVPEPASMALFALSGAALIRRRVD